MKEPEKTPAEVPNFRDEDALRERRARGIVSLGLISKAGNRFYIKSSSFKRPKVTNQVWRDRQGYARCTCGEYSLESRTNMDFRCEHILAVIHALKTGATIDTYLKTEEARGFKTSSPKDKEKMKRISPPHGAADASQNQETTVSVIPLAFTSTLRTLKQPIDPNLVKTREGWRDRQGNTHSVQYIEWHTAADILDRVAPSWSHAVRDIKQIGEMVAVTASITIDGVTREGVGTGTADSEMGIKKAEHDALKRAAVKFGIARELYQRESDVIEKEGAAQPVSFPRDPLAKSMSDLVTPKQLGMIRALAREAGVGVEEECQTVLRCKTDELSKRAASSYIDHLKGLGQQTGGMRRAG